ncbi:type II secretion system F family protein [Vibrio toranzoniae]|uniref:type II secretion system F family protein n=1 Tax=Vibrio toranzoniae TaxID=1194427 RepID=UPI001377C4E4|nr:type II secretion system F family protein [Vibrio toranzoniae]NAZ93101.1 type II secretion system F family protein [Vibrio toranzoniae]
MAQVYFLLSVALALCAGGCRYLAIRQEKLMRSSGQKLNVSSKPKRVQEPLMLSSMKWWRKSKKDHEKSLSGIVLAMRQAGYISGRQQVLCLIKMFLVWSGLFLIFTGQQYLFSSTMERTFLFYALFMAVGALLSLHWFRIQARKRARRINEEMLTTVHMMSILWQVGLSLEGLLKAYLLEAKELTPEVNKDIKLIVARIDAGQSREVVFNDMAQITLSSGFQDFLIMLSQAAATGGGLKESFQSLSELIYQHKRVELQEKVTKLSGKISIAMMALMFPALFIVLGGPAALALMAAFGG